MRVIRRSGELLKQIEPATGMHNSPKTKEADARSFSRTDAAREAGLSPHQAKHAQRVANIPDDVFEEMVEAYNFSHM